LGRLTPAPAVSRAVSRLEEELGVDLFSRVGRNIELTADGRAFQKEAGRAVGKNQDNRPRYRPGGGDVPISLSGTENRIAAHLPEVLRRLGKARVAYTLDVKVAPNTSWVERAILEGEAQLGIISGKTFSSRLTGAALGRLESRTLVGKGHPLHARAKRAVPVDEVLKHEFVSFSQAIFGGALAYAGAGDGWRDDKFPRKIGMKTESIGVALQAIESGKYLGYLPPALTRSPEVAALNVTGCPYTARTDSFLLAKNPSELSWTARLFG
jgi:DNA-binding transcriptional LysR family regulator